MAERVEKQPCRRLLRKYFQRIQVWPTKQGENPALAFFLQILGDHTSAYPGQLQPMSTDLVARLDDLVGGC